MSAEKKETVELFPGQELTLRTALELKVGDGVEVWGVRDVKMRVDEVARGAVKVTVTETPADFDDALTDAAIAGLEAQVEASKQTHLRLVQALDDLRRLKKERARGQG